MRTFLIYDLGYAVAVFWRGKAVRKFRLPIPLRWASLKYLWKCTRAS